MQSVPWKKLIWIAVFGFCMMELLDWTGITRGGFPSNWAVALIQVCVNIGWTVFGTTVAYFAMFRHPSRPSSAENELGESQASDRRPSKSNPRIDGQR